MVSNLFPGLQIQELDTVMDLGLSYNNNNDNNEYLDLAKELKKLWNMKVTIMPIVIGALGTDTKRLVHGLENLDIRERVETI